MLAIAAGDPLDQLWVGQHERGILGEEFLGERGGSGDAVDLKFGSGSQSARHPLDVVEDLLQEGLGLVFGLECRA